MSWERMIEGKRLRMKKRLWETKYIVEKIVHRKKYKKEKEIANETYLDKSTEKKWENIR